MAQLHIYTPRVIRDVLMARLNAEGIEPDFTSNTAYLNIHNGAKYGMLLALDQVIVDDPGKTGATVNNKYYYTRESVIAWLDRVVVKYKSVKFISMESVRQSLQDPKGDN